MNRIGSGAIVIGGAAALFAAAIVQRSSVSSPRQEGGWTKPEEALGPPANDESDRTAELRGFAASPDVERERVSGSGTEIDPSGPRPVLVHLRRLEEAREPSHALPFEPIELIVLRDSQIADRRTVRFPETDATLRLLEGDWLVAIADTLLPRAFQVEESHVAGGAIEVAVEPLRAVEGTILDADDGRTIDSARVGCTLPPISEEVPAEVARLIQGDAEPAAWTSATGRFRLLVPTDRSVTLRCSASGYCTTDCVDVALDGRPLSIALAPARTGGGRVVDAGGRAIAGAEVAVGRIGAIPVEERVVATTGEDGRFESTELPRARVALVARATGHASTRVEVDLRSDAPEELVLVLHPESILRGIVTDAAGVPLADATVLVGSLSEHLVVGSIATGQDGTFAMPWMRAGERYHVEIAADGFDPMDFGPIEWSEANQASRSSDDVGAGAGALTFVLEHRARLALRVVDEAGAPVPEFQIAKAAEVAAEAHDEHWWSNVEWTAVNSPRGECELPGLRRLPHRILLVAEGFVPAVVRAHPRAADEKAEPLVVVLEPSHRFAATLVDAGGTPIEGARIALATRGSFGERRPFPQTLALTDGAGVAVLDVPADRPFALVATRPGFAPALFDHLEAARPSPTLHWPSTGTLVGCVRARDRTLLGSICLRAEPEGSGTSTDVRPLPDGSFRFESLPAGPVRVRLVDEWSSTTWHTFAVRERHAEVRPDLVAEIEFDLSAQHVVEGTLVAPRVLEHERFDVVAWRLGLAGVGTGGGPELVTSTTELGGRFVLCGLSPGCYRVVARSRGTGVLAFAEGELTVSAAAPVQHLELRVSAPTSAIRVVDAATGGPMDGAWLELAGPEGFGDRPLLRVPCDSEGRIEIACSAGLAAAAGAAAIVHAPGHAARRVELSSPTEEGAARTVALDRAATLDLEIESKDPLALAEARVVVTTADGTTSFHRAESSLTLSELPAGSIELRLEYNAAQSEWSGLVAPGERRTIRLAIAGE